MKRYLRLIPALICALGVLALVSFFSKPSLERNTLLFGQSLSKILLGVLFAIPLIGSMLLCIYFDRVVSYLNQRMDASLPLERSSLPLRVVRIIYTVALISVTILVLVVFTRSHYGEGFFAAIFTRIAMARVLLLWVELVLLALPLLAFLGLSRSSWNLLVERSKPFPSHTFNKAFWKDAFLVSALVFALALITVVAVFKVAWVSEDSFITFRYVSNALHGFGPVFNIGERVQGYTHPLWFVLLLLGSRIVPNPIYISIGYGLALTFLTVVILGYTLSRIVANRLSAGDLAGPGLPPVEFERSMVVISNERS